LGYIQESGTWRNEYLTGAQELRYGKITPRGTIISYEVLNNLPLKDIFYLLSIRTDGLKSGNFDYKINFIIPDRYEAAATEVKRGIFRYLNNKPAEDAAVTVTMNKEALYQLATSNEKPDSLKIKVKGDIYKWYAFLAVIDPMDLGFNIVTPGGQ